MHFIRGDEIMDLSIMQSVIPDFTSSSTIYCKEGLSTITSISLGCAFVAGNTLVPNPAAGIIAFLTFLFIFSILSSYRIFT